MSIKAEDLLKFFTRNYVPSDDFLASMEAELGTDEEWFTAKLAELGIPALTPISALTLTPTPALTFTEALEEFNGVAKSLIDALSRAAKEVQANIDKLLAEAAPTDKSVTTHPITGSVQTQHWTDSDIPNIPRVTPNFETRTFDGVDGADLPFGPIPFGPYKAPTETCNWYTDAIADLFNRSSAIYSFGSNAALLSSLLSEGKISLNTARKLVGLPEVPNEEFKKPVAPEVK